MIPTIIAIWQLWGLFGQSCDVHVAPLVVCGLGGGWTHAHAHTHMFLNQARAWFLKVDPVRIVSMCVCLHVCVCVCVRPKAINN